MDPQTKPQYLDLINATLSRGSANDQVKALQQYLIGIGYGDKLGLKADGFYGPATEATVKQFQLDHNIKSDGVWGPQALTQAKTVANSGTPAPLPGTGTAADDPSKMFNTDTGEYNSKYLPKTPEEADAHIKKINEAVAGSPTFKGNTPEMIQQAIDTGDATILRDSNGQPFTQNIFEDALKTEEDLYKPRAKEDKFFNTENTKSNLDQRTDDYQRFLNSQKEKFEADKTALDENAAKNGILYSGGRYEKEQKLKKLYEDEGAYQLKNYGRDISNTARNYEYNYGFKSAPSLSKYYQLGTQNFNPSVAKGGVTSGALKNIYDPNALRYEGTVPRANKLGAISGAYKKLGNTGNKLLTTGYNN